MSHRRVYEHCNTTIMGLNPPFGLNAHLANKFIDKALTFKPKILILIVPEETRRLDSKSPHYDLIWEDRTSLSGKSFYLPGSIDVNDKQIEQWNVRPPVLYLWSRPDWTPKHMGIASSQGHKSKMPSSLPDKNTEEKYKERDANQGEKESMSLKEAASAEVDRREEASGQKETRREKKNIHEGFENKESAAAQKELGRGVHSKNKEAIPEKKSAFPGKKDGRQSAEKHNKKRKSPESHKDGTQKMKMVKKELQQQERQEEDGEDLPNMSISPPPRGEPIDLPPIQTSLLGSGLRNISSAARPSGIHEDLDTFPRRFGSVERESFYTPGTEAYGRYNSPDTYSPSKYGRIGYGRPDSDIRMQSRPYSMQEEEVPNSYGRPAESDIRAQIRTYGVSGEENHSDGIRFSVGGPGPSLGQIGMYPSPAYRFAATATDTSAMQRYAPRLDEMNHSRPRHLSPSMPFPGRDMQGLRRENPPDSFGFPPEMAPFSNRGSFGWIDD